MPKAAEKIPNMMSAVLASSRMILFAISLILREVVWIYHKTT